MRQCVIVMIETINHNPFVVLRNSWYCILLVFALGLSFSQCVVDEKGTDVTKIDFSSLDNESDSIVSVLITSPAGSNLLFKYNPENEKIEILDSLNYLPLPVNEGFIIGAWDEHGQPLRAIILGKREETGKTIEVTPIALLNRNVNDTAQHWILAVPNESSKLVVEAINLYDLLSKNQSILVQIENWFSNYIPEEKDVQVFWTSEKDAIDLLKISSYN